jgi:hypothetical protein
MSQPESNHLFYIMFLGKDFLFFYLKDLHNMDPEAKKLHKTQEM